MYYVGFCPLCGRGAVGVRVCGGQPGDTLLLCDECDAVWRDPDLSAPPILEGFAEVPCPTCGANLLKPPAHWATGEEVERAGWQEAVLGQGPALGEAPDASEPSA